jgi:hypothetical protein
MWVSSFGNGMKVGLLSTAGIAEFNGANSDDLILYPNPNSGTFRINIDKYLPDAIFKLMDVTGRIVYEKQVASSDIEIQGLNNGIYFWEVINDSAVIGRGKTEIIK